MKYKRNYAERKPGAYTGQGATEVKEANASRITSEEMQEHIEAFLANDGIIRRYDNQRPAQEIIA